MHVRNSTPLSKKAAAAIAATAIAAGGLVLAGPVAPAAAAPFQCTSNLYWVQDGQLWEGDALDDPFGQPVGPTNPTGSYNAIGFNEQDGLLWGIGSTGAIARQLVSIDDTGAVTAHGAPVGLPTDFVGGWNAGDVDDEGNLWVSPQGEHGLYKIDIATNTVTDVVIPPNAGPAAYAQDFVWYDGKIVRIHATSRVRIVDTATGAFTQSNSLGSGPQNSVAMWLDADERLFVVANNTGVISEVLNWQGANPTVATVATTTVRTLNGDGASCSSAPAPFGIIATDDDYSNTPIRADEGGTVGNIWTNDRLNVVTPPTGSITTTITDDGGLTGVTIGDDGSVAVPPGATPGTYEVSYEICSVAEPAQCDSATITVVIADPPSATDDARSTPAATPVEIDVLGNDTIGSAPLDPTTVRLLDPETGDPVDSVIVPGEGTWTVDPTTGAVTFTPQDAFSGRTTPLGYLVADENGLSAEAEIVVTVDAPVVAPVATDDTTTTTPGTPVRIDVLDNDDDGSAALDPTTVRLLDPETGDPVESVIIPGEGTWTVEVTTGVITFTPEDGFTGRTTSVTYVVTDVDGQLTQAEISVTVQAAAVVPPAQDSDEGSLATTGGPDVTVFGLLAALLLAFGAAFTMRARRS